MYKIDLAPLLRLFEEFQRSGSLQAEVPAGTFGLREPGRVQIDLVHGKVVTCVIQKRDGGSYASGTKALQMVQQVKDLHWEIQADVPPAGSTSPRLPVAPRYLPVPVQPPRPRVPVPVQVVAPNQYILNNLRFRQRRLFIMVDGKRNVAQLARLLSLSLAEIEETLGELRALGLIVMQS